MSSGTSSSKDDGSIMEENTETEFVMNLGRREWPACMPTLLADPVVQQYACACPMTGLLIISNIRKFMEAVHRRYGKSKTFDNFKYQMSKKWGWVFLEKDRGDNFCYCVHEMGFGRGGFDWAAHPTTDEIKECRNQNPNLPPAERIRLAGLVMNPPTLPPLKEGELSYLFGRVSAQMHYCGQIEPNLKNWIQHRMQVHEQHFQQHKMNLYTIQQLLQKKSEAVNSEEGLKIAADQVGSGGGQGVDQGGAPAEACSEGDEVSGTSDGAAGGVEQIVDDVVSMFCTAVDAPFDDDQIAAL